VLLVLLLAFVAVALGRTKPIKPLAKTLRCHGCHLVAETVLAKMFKIGDKSKDEAFLVGHRMQANRKKARKKAYFGEHSFHPLLTSRLPFEQAPGPAPGQDAVGFPTQHDASCGPRFFTHSRRIPAGSEAMALDVLEDVCDGVLDKGDKLTK